MAHLKALRGLLGSRGSLQASSAACLAGMPTAAANRALKAEGVSACFGGLSALSQAASFRLSEGLAGEAAALAKRAVAATETAAASAKGSTGVALRP
jgi:hypothetical protein